MLRLADTVTIVRAPSLAEDPYGNITPDWANAVSTVSAAEVQPLSSSEDVVNLQETVTRWRVYLPPTADVLATDRLVHDSQTFDVDGEVERWKRRGVLHHLELVAKKVTQ